VFYDRAVESATQAVESAAGLAEAHSALGYALHNGRLDPKAARGPYDRSRELGAGDADVLRTFALYSAFTLRPADADGAIAAALSLDPLNSGAFRAAGYVAYAKRDFAETIAKMRAALELNPKESVVNAAIGSALYLTSQLDAAKTAFAAEPLPIFRLQGLAIAEAKLDNKPAAQAAYDQLIADYGANANYQQAQVLAQWGDRPAAMARLEAAAASRDSGMLLAPTDAMLDPIRTLPEFSQLLSKMGLA
jgi:tetratricopeptide (TPR) repeat protein